MGVLKEAEAGAKTADLTCRYGVSEATIYNWKSKYGGLEVSEARRLKGLESENAQLERPRADTMLGQRILWQKLLRPAAQREAVTHFQTHLRMSERRVCRVSHSKRVHYLHPGRWRRSK